MAGTPGRHGDHAVRLRGDDLLHRAGDRAVANQYRSTAAKERRKQGSGPPRRLEPKAGTRGLMDPRGTSALLRPIPGGRRPKAKPSECLKLATSTFGLPASRAPSPSPPAYPTSPPASSRSDAESRRRSSPRCSCRRGGTHRIGAALSLDARSRWRIRRASGTVGSRPRSRRGLRSGLARGRTTRSSATRIGDGEQLAKFGAPCSGRLARRPDVFAKPGTPLVSVRDGHRRGRRARDGADPGCAVHTSATLQPARWLGSYVYLHLLPGLPRKAGRGRRSGQPIGQLGCTGSCDGPHLHLRDSTLRRWYREDQGGRLPAADGAPSGLRSRCPPRADGEGHLQAEPAPP